MFEYHAPATSRLNEFYLSRTIRSKRVIRHVFITQALRTFYLRKYLQLKDQDIIVLPDGADVIDSSFQSSDLMMIQQERTECGYLGSFQKGKGVELILELAKKEPDIIFHIIGGTKKQIDEFIKDYDCPNIIWHGYKSQIEAMHIMRKVNIALLPNQPNVLVGPKQYDIGKWTSPMKLFEYMALGKPIIASDLPVIREILTDGKNSILVSFNNSDQWIEAIKKLHMDQDLSRFIGDNAKRELVNKYSWRTRALEVLKGINCAL